MPKKALAYEEDTIAAIATPFGESGIGIVRVSGHLAESICNTLFRGKRGSQDLLSHRLYYGEIVDPDTGTSVDEVLVVLMRAPKTYTREDCLEIHCHGGYLVLQRVLELVLKQGARIALPGEFTKRAFLNGRIDLTQAEAVIDLIRSRTVVGLEIANRQLKGVLHDELFKVKRALTDVAALIEADIDFPEEDLEPLTRERLLESLRDLSTRIFNMAASYEEGKIFREGISCTIVGKTNVGKSSLLNVLLKEERAIVTPIPGTTRDVIEEVLNIGGIPVKLVDTAGVRESIDPVEIEGVKRTKQRIAESDLILFVLDGSQPLGREDFEILEEIMTRRMIVVVNKKDLPLVVSEGELGKFSQGNPVVFISALESSGIDELKETIYTSLVHTGVKNPAEDVIVTNLRHKEALLRAYNGLDGALNGLEDGVSSEFIAFDLRCALDAIGEIVGEVTTEDILGRIFEQFCVGK